MRRSDTLVIFRKELSVLRRSKRTLMATLIIPLLLFPSTSAIVNYISHMQADTTAHAEVAVSSLDDAPDFVASALASTYDLKVMDEMSARDALVSGQLDVYISWIRGNRGTEEHVDVLYSSRSTQSSVVAHTIEQLASTQNDATLAQVSQVQAVPYVVVGVSDISDGSAETYLVLQSFASFALVMGCCMGASNIAGHLSAGEREKHTLDALVSTGVNVSSIVGGKLLTTFVPSVASGICALVSICVADALWLHVLDLSTLQIAFCAVGVLLAAAVFSPVQLLAGFCAKSYREAQTYSGVITVVSMLPMYWAMSTVAGREAIEVWAMPVVNLYCLLRSALASLALGSAQLTLVLSSTCLVVVACALATTAAIKRGLGS